MLKSKDKGSHTIGQDDKSINFDNKKMRVDGDHNQINQNVHEVHNHYEIDADTLVKVIRQEIQDGLEKSQVLRSYKDTDADSERLLSQCDDNVIMISVDEIKKFSKSDLKKVIITGGESIDAGAFENCTELTSITIPSSVRYIGECAFEGCNRLTNIYYTGDIAGWCGISGLNYIMSSSLTLYIGGNKVEGDLVIPDGVTSIGDFAFQGCSGLTSVTIGNSVTSIGDGAFRDCIRLTSIYYTGDIAGWCGISGLNYIISSSLTLYIGGNKVEGELVIPNGVTSIGDFAFQDCRGLTSVTIGNSVTSIGDGAFYGCSGLTSITIPDSVTSIGSYAFYDCRGLTSVTIGSGVKSIGSFAFYDCRGLTSITIPDSVTSIGSYAFYDCNGLTSIIIPDSVHFIGGFAFANCTKLTQVIMSKDVSFDEYSTFSGCSNLTEIKRR